jgi:hypothetical protein
MRRRLAAIYPNCVMTVPSRTEQHSRSVPERAPPNPAFGVSPYAGYVPRRTHTLSCVEARRRASGREFVTGTRTRTSPYLRVVDQRRMRSLKRRARFARASGFQPEASAGSSRDSADLRVGRIVSNRRRTTLAAIDSDRERPSPGDRRHPGRGIMGRAFGDTRRVVMCVFGRSDNAPLRGCRTNPIAGNRAPYVGCGPATTSTCCGAATPNPIRATSSSRA